MVIHQIQISLFLKKKKNCISPPIVEVSMNAASYKHNKSTSPIIF